MSDDPTDEILWTSGVNPEGKPFVHLQWGSKRAQLTPDETRHTAKIAFEVAEAAEMDATFWGWLAEQLPEVATENKAHLLYTFREYRDKAREKGEAP